MGRKSGSYKFEKRQKELKKQKKKHEKLERRQNKDFEDEPQPSVDGDALPGENVDPAPEEDPES